MREDLERMEQEPSSFWGRLLRGVHRPVAGLLVLLLLGGIFFPEAVFSGKWLAFLITSVQPDPIYVEMDVGATEVVSIFVTNVENLHSVQLYLSFDPTVLQVVDAYPDPGVQVAMGTILSPTITGFDGYVLQNVDNVAGTIEVVASYAHPGTTFDGSGSLIDITFLGIANGWSALQIAEEYLDLPLLVDPYGTTIEVEWNDGLIVVGEGETPTPTATGTLTATPTGTPTTTSTVPAEVRIVPPHREITTGVTTTVDVGIFGATNLAGVALHIQYDPDIVHIVDSDLSTPITIEIALGEFPYPDFVAQNEADNATGDLHVAFTQMEGKDPVNGDGVMGTVTFVGLQAGISPITITSAMLSDPDGAVLPSVTYDGEIQVLDECTIVGQVHFQGRDDPPFDLSCPLSVTLFVSGEIIPTYTFTPNTDATGVFTVTDISANIYDVKVRDLHSLWNVREDQPIVLGINALDMGTLVEGDADLSGVIDLLDVSVLASTFGTSVGDTLFNARADFNNSYDIDILDYSLLASNYKRSGETILTGSGH